MVWNSQLQGSKRLKFILLILLSFFIGLNIVSQNVLAAKIGLDPTRPLSGSIEMNASILKSNKNLVLESIFHGSHGSKTHTVIINGQSLKVNDFIGEYKLIAVNDGSVVLRSPDKSLKLYIFPSVVTK